MFKVLEKWLENRFGIVADFALENFKALTRDGTLIAMVLENYGIISLDEMQQIEETIDPTVAYCNYSNYIALWLLRLNIKLTEVEILEITNGQGTAIVTLFLQLYAELEEKSGQEKDKFYKYITDTKVFTVNPVKYYLLDDLYVEPNPLCAPLKEQWDVIHWEQDHITAMMRKFRKSMKQYETFMKDREIKHRKLQSKTELRELNNFCRDQNEESYQELLRLQEKAQKMEQFIPDYDKAKKVICNLRRKRQRQAERDALKLRIQKELLAELWDKLRIEAEYEYNKDVSEKLLKKSNYEQHLAKKLLNIRMQKEKIIEKRRQEDEAEARRKDNEFIHSLLENDLEERLRFHEERVEQINLHRKLYEEKMRLKALKHLKLSQDVMNDVVDLSLKWAEYKQTYGQDPTKILQHNWATLFVKQQPIMDFITPVEQIKQKLEKLPQEIEEMYMKEVQRQDILDQEDLEDYLNFRNIWEVELESETQNRIDLGMNVIGYIVHKLLLKRYPLRVPRRPELSEEIEISVCANIGATNLLDYLQRLLRQKNVKIIEMEDAKKFCINAFDTENTVEYEQTLHEDFNSMKVLGPSKKEVKAEKGGKKEKVTKKDKASKKDKGAKPDKKGKKGDETPKEEEVVVVKEEKVNQTPRLFPDEAVVLTNKAILGQKAKEQIDANTEIDAKLLVDMFIEYLLSLKDIKGWALINFPTNFDETAHLEQALTGKPVSKEYFDKVLNRKSLESLQIEQTTEEGDTELNEEQQIKEGTPAYQKQVEDAAEEEQFRQSTVGENSNISVSEKRDRHGSKVQFNKSQLTMQIDTYSMDMNIVENSILKVQKENASSRICVVLPDYASQVSAKAFGGSSDSDLPTERKESESGKVTEEVDMESREIAIISDQYSVDQVCKCECIKKSLKVKNQDSILEHIGVGEPEIEVENQQECQCFIVKEPEKEPSKILSKVEIELVPEISDGELEKLRLSQLVPNCRPLEKIPYKTPLTAYIKALPKSEEENDFDAAVPYYKELEKSDGLEKFYCDQGCYYLLQYEEFDSDAVKCLAKMIIGDYSVPLKSSVELFGDRYMEATFEVGDNVITKKGKKEAKEKKQKIKKAEKSDGNGKKEKKGKDKKEKKEKKTDKKDKGSKKDKKGKAVVEEKPPLTFEDKESQFPIVEEEEVEEIPEPKAGESGWIFVELYINKDNELALAQFWENMERNFILQMKQMFFNKRVFLNAIMPYIVQVREKMEQFLERPDEKQTHLHQFQAIFNQINLDCRRDEETKTELVNHIENLKDKLLSICDYKMEESEEERKKLIGTCWVYKQLKEIIKNSMFAFQLELDCFTDTVQFVTDYYKSMCLSSAMKPEQQLLQKEQLINESEDDLCEEFNLIITNYGVENTETVFHTLINATLNDAKEVMDKVKTAAMDQLQEIEKLIKPKEKAKKIPKKGAKAIEIDGEVKDNADRILEEWNTALNGEFARIEFRLNLIKDEMIARLDEIIKWTKDVFYEIYEGIEHRYKKELDCVTKACELLMKSVEEEEILQPELVLEQDELYKIEIELFPEVTASTDLIALNDCFEISKLNFMVKVLSDLAPSGYIIKNTFLLLLQDMVYQESEAEELEEHGSEVEESEEIRSGSTPVLWRNLSMDALINLTSRLFDDNEYVYWKDFIVCNLMIPFPSRKVLMETRNDFKYYDHELTETINRYDFNHMTFWFEDYQQDFTKIKNLLFKLYSVDNETINYSAMLLDFCKDENPVHGFVKALELSLGKFICYDNEIGMEYVKRILDQRSIDDENERVRQEEHDRAMIEARKALENAVDDLVHNCESLVITEVQQESPDDNYFENIRLGSFEKASNTSSLCTQFSQDSINVSLEKREKGFSNLEIGFEAHGDTGLAYFLPLKLVLDVIQTAIPWHSKLDSKEEGTFCDRITRIYDNCRNPHFNNAVLTHEFLNCDEFTDLFGKIAKFSSNNPVKMIKKIIKEPVIEEEVVGETVIEGEYECRFDEGS